MKFSIETKAFRAAIDAAQRIVDGRSTIPILNNVCIEAKGGAVTVRASDLDRMVFASAPATVDQDGGTTIPASMIYDVIRKLPDGSQATLEEPEKDKVVLRSGRSRFTFQTLPTSDFPDMTAEDMPCRFTMPSADLFRIFTKAGFSASDDMKTRAFLCGVYLHVIDGKLRGVATNGHHFSQLDADLPDGAANLPGIIVPAKMVGEVIRLLDKDKGAVTVEAGTSKIRITCGDMSILSKLIDAQYPDYLRAIPSDQDKIAIFDRAELHATADRVGAVCGSLGNTVKVTLRDSAAVLTTRDTAGEAHEELRVDYDGPEISIGFNVRYLLRVLDMTDGDTVMMKLSEPGSPAIIKTREGSDMMALIMPMRI
jgi:DNA polymerase III subunit beta